jgi:hypothetical protein
LKHDIYLEREKLRVLQEDEKNLKRSLMRFINEHGGSIREWRQGTIRTKRVEEKWRKEKMIE